MKSDRLAYWLDQTTLDVRKYLKGGKDRISVDPDGKKLTLEDYMILGNIDTALGGNAAMFKNIMDMRYGIQQAGSGAELTASEDNEIQVSFGTRDNTHTK